MEVSRLLQSPVQENHEVSSELQRNGFIWLNRELPSPSGPQAHSNNIARLTNQLQAAVKDLWPNRYGSRYRSVRVLLTHWAADDLGVRNEVRLLEHVFSDLYRYNVSIYSIPNHQPDRALKRRVIEFVDDDQQDTLLIFYYAGHAFLNPSRHDVTVWAAHRGSNPPTLPSSGIQSLLEEADCDVVLLYDTCHSADTAITPARSSRGVTEVIAACGFEAVAPEVGEHSFTNSLAHVLAMASQGPAFLVSELHSRILMRLRSWAPSPMRDPEGKFVLDQYGGLVMEPQRRRTPVHCNLSHRRMQRSIILAPLSVAQGGGIHGGLRSRQCLLGKPIFVAPGNLQSGPSRSQLLLNPPTMSNPELTISVKLADEVVDGRHKPDTNVWLEWLRNAPPEANEIEIDLKEKDHQADDRYEVQEANSGSEMRSAIEQSSPRRIKEPLDSTYEQHNHRLPQMLSNGPLLDSFTEMMTPGFRFFQSDSVAGNCEHGNPSVSSQLPQNPLTNRQQRQRYWSSAEDALLIQLVHTQGALNWVRISQLIGSRSPKECRERYQLSLKPLLNHEPISDEEGLEIERLVGEMGKQWAEISRRLHGRSDNAVKNWWNGSVNRRRRLILRRTSSSQSPVIAGKGLSQQLTGRAMPVSYTYSVVTGPQLIDPPTQALWLGSESR